MNLEQKDFKKLLEMIKKDLESGDNEGPFMTIFFILDDLLNSLGACGVENTNTYFLSARTKDANYKITITFDSKYTNIFAKSDITKAITSLKLEIEPKSK